jgi:hypothetical protein
VILAAEHSTAVPAGDVVAVHASLAFNAGFPMWLVATFLAITVIVRRRQRALLRC